MQDYRSLKVWEKGHQLTLGVYRATARFPDHERFGLISQMRRSSMSIPTNLAEGSGRGTDADFARFVQNAVGSANELDYQVLLASELGYVDEPLRERLERDVTEVRRMLIALIGRLRR